MALTKLTTKSITGDTLEAGDLGANSVDSSELVDGSIDTSHIANSQITNALMADDAIGVAELSATGTASSSTFLRGDNSWATAGTTYAGIDDQSSSNDDQLTITDSTVVINEDGDNVDFRVESDTKSHCLFVDASGNSSAGFVSINTDSNFNVSNIVPSVGLTINAGNYGAATASASADELVITNAGSAGMSILTNNDQTGSIYFGDQNDFDVGQIVYNHSDNTMQFTVDGGEVMRIDDNSTLLVNATAKDVALNGNVLRGYQYFAGNIEAGTNDYASMFIKHTSAKMHGIVMREMHSSGTQIDFTNAAGSRVGVINHDGSNVAYNTSSDYRLKENETLITDGIDRVKQLKPYRLNYKIEPDKTVDAFFAHEVSSVVPEAVTGDKDAMMFEKDGITPILDEDENNPQQRIDVQQLDQAKLVPLLTSALKEAITKIETLETKVTALENA